MEQFVKGCTNIAECPEDIVLSSAEKSLPHIDDHQDREANQKGIVLTRESFMAILLELESREINCGGKQLDSNCQWVCPISSMARTQRSYTLGPWQQNQWQVPLRTPPQQLDSREAQAERYRYP